VGTPPTPLYAPAACPHTAAVVSASSPRLAAVRTAAEALGTSKRPERRLQTGPHVPEPRISRVSLSRSAPPATARALAVRGERSRAAPDAVFRRCDACPHQHRREEFRRIHAFVGAMCRASAGSSVFDRRGFIRTKEHRYRRQAHECTTRRPGGVRRPGKRIARLTRPLRARSVVVPMWKHRPVLLGYPRRHRKILAPRGWTSGTTLSAYRRSNAPLRVPNGPPLTMSSSGVKVPRG
jgi:hypothetical protein